MRILIITEEDEFYIPLALQHILENCPYHIVEVACARNPLLPSKYAAFKKFFAAFGLMPIIKHAMRLAKTRFLSLPLLAGLSKRSYSVRSVCRKFNVPYFWCHNVNAPDFLERCRKNEVDLVMSVSPTQIFKEGLISLPKYGCLNTHSALLPNYRGLYPTYWAMASGEKTMGVTIHCIEKGIDTGKIVLQAEIPIPQRTTMDHMLRVTKIKGAELMLEAVKQIADGTAKTWYPADKGTYFSFPTRESYRQFRRFGYRLW
jgi:methionyl-tRNA formyltransferase